ncbi:transposase [Virgibacillus ndiopensis]
MKHFQVIYNTIIGNLFWIRSYMVLTTGGATIDMIKRYIEEQRQ